jgi:hypothetical protein
MENRKELDEMLEKYEHEFVLYENRSREDSNTIKELKEKL